MTQPAKAQEPSMEEILASIRRIIADDDASKSPPRPADPSATPRPAASAAPPRQAAAVSPSRPTPTPPPGARGEPVQKADEIDAMLNELNKESDKPNALDLTEPMAAAPRSEGGRTIDGQSNVVLGERAAAASRDGPPATQRPLISASTSAAVDSAFNTLAHTVLVQNARTLEDLVREMLRPMLKTWLDDNLPGVVERLVRGEIERLSRGRG